MPALDAINPLPQAERPKDWYEPAKNTGNILIVDSVASRRGQLVDMLSGLAATICTAANASDALSIIGHQRIDMVLLDFEVPDIGAANFCRIVRDTAGIKFLQLFVLAQSNDMDLEVAAIEAGADEFLAAPLRERALCARVRNGLRHKQMVDSPDDSEAVLFSLATSVEERDPDLSSHCHRLAKMSSAFGNALQLPSGDIIALQRGAYLHDIGKISIPDRVLFKPGALTQEEWEIMRSHTTRGEKICSGIRSLFPVLPIIRSHHERWDGKGYPDGLAGKQIPLLARVLQLADIYDALTSLRPYKSAVTPNQAMAVIYEETERGWRDPDLVRVFAEIIPVFQSAVVTDPTDHSLNALAYSVESFREASSVEPVEAETPKAVR